jgi:hypothetical protein
MVRGNANNPTNNPIGIVGKSLEPLIGETAMTPTMKEAHRAPGAEWLKNHPAALESIYDWTKKLVKVTVPALRKLSPALATRVVVWGEEVTKGYVFNCQMCGQCILHSTGMTCPMNCPKNLRNGPCGGVRPNGHCEVIPEMPCVWVQAWDRYGADIQRIQPPVNRALQGTSAWINLIDEIDTQTPKGWPPLSQ